MKRFEKLFYDLNQNIPQLKTPEKVFHWETSVCHGPTTAATAE